MRPTASARIRSDVSLVMNIVGISASRSLTSSATARMRLSIRAGSPSDAGKRHPFCERALGAERVQVASHDARVAPQLALVALELVDLLDDVDGNDDVVVVKAEQRPRIVQQDVGVEDEVLFHRLAGGFPRARPRDAAVGLLAPRFHQYRHGADASGRSNAAGWGAEQVLHRPGHRWPGHAVPGKAP